MNIARLLEFFIYYGIMLSPIVYLLITTNEDEKLWNKL